MASPSTAVNRFDLSMSYGEFALAMNQQGFIGHRVLPPIPVAKNASSFAKIPIKALLSPIESTKRASKAGYKRSDFTCDQDSYAVEDHGVEEELDDETLDLYRDVIRAEAIHSQRAINRVAQAYENDVAAAVFNTTTWTGATLSTAVGTPWSTIASADPVADIDAAIEKVKGNCGRKPNTLILTDLAFRKITRCASITDKIKYSGFSDPTKDPAFIQALKDLLQLDEILTGSAFKNTAGDGAAASLSRLWDSTKAMVCCTARQGNMDLESPDPCIGRTIVWEAGSVTLPGGPDGALGMIVEEYREESRRGSALRARNHRQVKILHAAAGHLLTNVTA